MSPWPGAPKSASSPPINPPSQRYPFTLNEGSSMKDVAEAVKVAFNGLAVHEQAFANLPNQISTMAAAAATTAIQNFETVGSSGVASFNTLTGAVLFFPGLFQVHDERHQVAYTTQAGDSGSVILLADSSPIALTLNTTVIPPWGCFISNTDSGPIRMAADSPGFLINNDSSLALPGQSWCIMFFSGTAFWALGVAS